MVPLFQPTNGSLPVISEHVELVKRTMAGISLPAPGVPAWAREISDAQWEDVVKSLECGQVVNNDGVYAGHIIRNIEALWK